MIAGFRNIVNRDKLVNYLRFSVNAHHHPGMRGSLGHLSGKFEQHPFEETEIADDDFGVPDYFKEA